VAEPVQFNQQIVCDTCGQFGAFEFDGRTLCGACYEACGSCCPEFDKTGSQAGVKTAPTALRTCRNEAGDSP
jgi:hypothetical protein